MRCRSTLFVLWLLLFAIGCGGGEPRPQAKADAKIDEEQKTLRKLDSANEKEQVEGAREAVKQFGESKREDKK